ncbi:MAG: hypothetical protein HYX48_05100 [Chlamydiales bacterium]|nr:hypothetical protein [Chlamydiales bacterium]
MREKQIEKTLKARKVVEGQAFWQVEGLCSVLVSYLDPTTGYEVANHFHPNRWQEVFTAAWHRHIFKDTSAAIDFAKDPWGCMLINISRNMLHSWKLSDHERIVSVIKKTISVLPEKGLPDLEREDSFFSSGTLTTNFDWVLGMKQQKEFSLLESKTA